MTEPRAFPLRKEIHGSRPAPKPLKSFPTRQSLNKPPSEDGAPSRVGAHRRQEPPSRSAGQLRNQWWVVSVAFWVTVVSVLGLFLGAYGFWRGSLPPVLTVVDVFDPVHVTGRLGSPPVVILDSPITVEETESRTLYEGSGREVTEGSPVLLSVSAYDGQKGLNLSETGQPALVVGDVDAASIGATLSALVVGNHEGSRLLVARKLDSGATEINIVDILYTIARGQVMEASEGVLTVNVAEEGISVSHADGAPPNDLTIQVLIQGDGQQISAGDEVVAQYLAVGWDDGKTVTSTWDAGAPRIIELQTAMPGIREALVDQRVGSRLAITIPPEKATGEGTLCIVVDILGTTSPIGTDLDDEDE